MLRGARFVTAQEIEDGQQWAEGKIKALTGGDPISAHLRDDGSGRRPIPVNTELECGGAALSPAAHHVGPVTTKLCKVAIDRRGDRCRRISVGFPTTRLSEPRSQPFGHAWRADG